MLKLHGWHPTQNSRTYELATTAKILGLKQPFLPISAGMISIGYQRGIPNRHDLAPPLFFGIRLMIVSCYGYQSLTPNVVLP